MPFDLTKTLRTALTNLQAESKRIAQQIAAIRAVLGGPGRATGLSVARPRRRRMSAAARADVSRRMKAYWAKRRAENTKKKGASAKRKAA